MYVQYGFLFLILTRQYNLTAHYKLLLLKILFISLSSMNIIFSCRWRMKEVWWGVGTSRPPTHPPASTISSPPGPRGQPQLTTTQELTHNCFLVCLPNLFLEVRVFDGKIFFSKRLWYSTFKVSTLSRWLNLPWLSPCNFYKGLSYYITHHKFNLTMRLI